MPITTPATSSATGKRRLDTPEICGRRLLSDDVMMLERVAVLAARRIDALRLSDERYERMLREREISTLATEAELRALRAQINPHFLFTPSPRLAT